MKCFYIWKRIIIIIIMKFKYFMFKTVNIIWQLFHDNKNNDWNDEKMNSKINKWEKNEES